MFLLSYTTENIPFAQMYIMFLQLFVIAGSGMWPQVKQFGTIALWFLPTSFLPIRARGMLLHIFDFLGKWTMACELLMQHLEIAGCSSGILFPHTL